MGRADGARQWLRADAVQMGGGMLFGSTFADGSEGVADARDGRFNGSARPAGGRALAMRPCHRWGVTLDSRWHAVPRLRMGK